MTLNLIKFIFCFLFSIRKLFTVYSRAGRPVFFLEPVPLSNRFIGTGFSLGNRFKVNKKNINKRSKIKVKFEVFLGKLVPNLFL